MISQEDFSNYMQKADLIITHGGVGSIITALNHGKKVIAAPRLSKYGEHVNDHQLQIIKCFEQKNYILKQLLMMNDDERKKFVESIADNDLVELAKEKGTPVLEGIADDLKEKTISACQNVIDKLEEK